MNRRAGPRLALLLALAALTGCAGSTPGAAPTFASPTPLVAALDPCPAAAAGPVDGGLQDDELDCLGPGPRVRLSALRGPLLVNVWASWCGPCIDEVPRLEAFYRAARGKVAVMGIDFQDTRESALDKAAQLGMTYPSVFDGDGETRGRSFRAAGPPETLFVDAQGRVVHRKVGPFASRAEIESLVEQHLGVSL